MNIGGINIKYSYLDLKSGIDSIYLAYMGCCIYFCTVGRQIKFIFAQRGSADSASRGSFDIWHPPPLLWMMQEEENI